MPTFDLDEVMGGNDEYIDKSSSKLIQLFNDTCILRYTCPRKVVFLNGSDFKRDFTPLLKYFNIKPGFMKINNPQGNFMVERVNQVIYKKLVTKDIDNKVFVYIYPWCKTLAYIARSIWDSYHRNVGATPCQAIFVTHMIFNLVPVIDW